MRLKGLELQGFKSFADRTLLDFENGITAVVGPNGSGKSNIADAMRWVMGEQSAKSLRGGNMQDVIFSGTQKRKPLNFAEVSLIIDNSDKKLPIDFDEVIVTRRLFRSGESEYFINKSSVRLKDIHELFMDTGVGRDGYSIISQGKIAEIVNTKSEDRRTMFEEAAGITKFRYRKEEAERKLDHTNDNVLRVNDIITEIEGQIGPLKQQSEKAKQYLNYRDKLKVLEVNVALNNIVKYRKMIDEVGSMVDNLNSQLADINVLIEENERKTEDIFKSINETDEVTLKSRQKQEENVQTLSEYKSDIEVLKSKIDGNNENISRINAEIAELNLKYDEIQKSVEDDEAEYNELLKKREDISSTISDKESKLFDFDKDMASSNEYIADINTEIIENMNEIANLRSKISNYNALIQTFGDRANVISNELLERNTDFERLVENTNNLQKDYDKISAETEDLKERFETAQNDYSRLVQELAAANNELNQNHVELQQAESRQKLLKDLEKSFDNYSKSVKAVMKEYSEGSLKGLKLYGTVASLVKVDAKYETAIEVALGASAQYIVTETEDDAKKSIEFLKQSKQGRATFLPVSAAKGNAFTEKGVDSHIGYIGIASELVSYDKKYNQVMTDLLGRVVVVDNIDNAIKMARSYSYKFRIVTLQGELLAPGGSMSGGSKNNSAGLFSRANEIKKLDSVIKDLIARVEESKAKVNKLNKSIETNKEEVETLRQTVGEKSNELIKISADYEHTKAFLDNLTDAKNSLEEELKQIDAQVLDMKNHITVHDSEIEALNDKIIALEKDIQSKKDLIGESSNHREGIVAQINDLRAQVIEINKDIELYNQRLAMVNARKQEINLNIEQKQNNIKEMNDANEDINDDIEFKNQQIEDITAEIEELKNDIEKFETSRKEAQESIKAQQEENKKLRENQLVVQQEQSRVENKKTKTESDLENIINKLWEDYELTTTTAEDLRQEIPDNATKQINELKNNIKELGNINIDAIEEYKQVGERYEFLKTQRDDLVAAQKNLEQVIADMILIMKEQFADKFETINKHFGETFVQLFGGGRAELSLTDPDDVLNSGVEINVQPEGKALKSMMQLSGGEQAFVSIALLFAVLKVRPAPFCVLDEIEAALDDVNVYRFADYLKKFNKNSQFIVVTHRRGTMEAANMLYGVTMQERGVSRLLSLNIDDVVDMNLV